MFVFLVMLAITTAISCLLVYGIGRLIGIFAFRSLPLNQRALITVIWSYLLVLILSDVAWDVFTHMHHNWRVHLTDGLTMLPGALLAWWVYWRRLKRA